MSVFLKAGALALGVAALAAPADAITIIEEPGSNLAAFSYTVDSDAKVITLRETWGPATATEVLLKFVDWPHGLDGWRVDKFVTNQTGDAWISFAHELLQSNKGSSPDRDGLSFAQFGNPYYPRSSDKFPDLFVDEDAERDYLRYGGGLVASGETVFFSYGLTNRRETEATEPFYLRQSEFLRARNGVVPEPASWALLIAGFGVVGATARRRGQRLAHVSR
jgi:hypothetical protein